MQNMKSKIVWFTGLSGSGKTTLSFFISKKLKKKKFKVKIIDGDIFRKKNNTNKFTKKEITKNNLQIIRYIDNLRKNYDYVIVSVISPLEKTRRYAYKKFKSSYFEVHTKCNLKELIKRDPKKLYDKAKKNIIKNLIGFNSKIKYEQSNHKKLVIDTSKNNKAICSKTVLNYVLKNEKNY